MSNLRLVPPGPPEGEGGGREKKKFHPTAENLFRLDSVLEQMMLHNHSVTAINRLAQKEFGAGPAVVAKRREIIRQRWVEEYDEQRPHLRRMAEKRLNQHIEQARKAGKWDAVVNMERLLAQMQGTLEPERVVHEFQTGDILSQLLSSQDVVDDYAAEVRMLEQKAAQYDALRCEIVESRTVEQGGRVVESPAGAAPVPSTGTIRR